MGTQEQTAAFVSECLEIGDSEYFVSSADLGAAFRIWTGRDDIPDFRASAHVRVDLTDTCAVTRADREGVRGLCGIRFSERGRSVLASASLSDHGPHADVS